MKPSVFIAGNFPPPVTGQTLLTERLGPLIAPHFDVTNVSLNAYASGRIRTHAGLSALSDAFGARRKLREAFAKGRPDAILWPSISPKVLGHSRDAIAILPHIPAGIPLIAIIHWGNFDRLFTRFISRPSSKKLIERVSAFVFNTENLAQRCAPWIPEKKRLVVPNTIDDEVYCSPEELTAKWENPPEGRPLKALFLSNMILSKGYLTAMDAVRLVHEKGLPIKARFVGRWPEDLDRRGAESFVVGNKLTDVIELVGPVSDRAEIKKLHLEADVLVFPTYYPNEAFPLTLVETLNAGTPVVSTPHAGIPEMVRDGQEGYLVKPKDANAVAYAIERAGYTKNWETLSRQARNRFNSVYSQDAVRAQWREMITSVAGL